MQRGWVLAKRQRLTSQKKEAAPDRAVSLFLDSGVFSAWNRGESLDIKKYIEFVKETEHLLTCYANMDVIPGKFGEKRTMDQVEASAQGSYKNQQIMKDAGLTPIPIFHQGESFTWLDKMLNEGEPYIGISTAKDVPNREQRRWLDHVWSVITDKNGVPYVKTHGFGITNISLLLRYPWYTCDSTTWSLAAGFGLVYIPGIRSGKPDYSQLPVRIIMSGRQQSAWSSAKRQYEALSDIERAHVDHYLNYVGVSIPEARYLSSARRAACLKYFMDFAKSYRLKPFKFRHGVTTDFRPNVPAPPLRESMSVIFATMLTNGQFSQIMTDAGARTRLLSYWEFVKRKDGVEALERYVTHGIYNLEYKQRPPPRDWGDTHTSHRRIQLVKRLEMLNAIGTQEAD
jgi:hypothetical protein